MSILVTGGTGFVGAHLTRKLVEEKGEDVVVFDRYPNLQRVEGLLDRLTIVEGDILEPQELMSAMAVHDVDRVVHLAGIFGATQPDRALQFTRTQCVGTANVFETARLHGVTRLVNASSVAVFGRGPEDPHEAATEEDLTAPGDLYGASKLWSEHLANFYNRHHEIQILSLRISPSLGLGRLHRASFRAGLTSERRNYMAAPEIIALGEPVVMPPAEQVADFLYVDDTAEAFWLALSQPRPEHSVFNLSAERRTLGDYTRLLRELMPEGEIDVASDGGRLVPLMDNTRLRDELDFRPRYALEEAVAEYVRQVRALDG